jgi:hypothetical protein
MSWSTVLSLPLLIVLPVASVDLLSAINIFVMNVTVLNDVMLNVVILSVVALDEMPENIFRLY